MRKKDLYFVVGLTTLMIGAAGCSPQGYQAVENIASETIQDIACKSPQLETKLWDGLKTYLLEQKTIPTAEALQTAFENQLTLLQKQNPTMTAEQKNRLLQALNELTEALLQEAPQGERVETPEQLLLLLSAMDVGDRTTVFRSYMQDKVRAQFGSLQKTVGELSVSCDNSSSGANDSSDSGGDGTLGQDVDVVETPAPVEDRDYNYHLQKAVAAGEAPAVFGGRWAFATAYQSCQSNALPSLNNQSPDVQGISIVGKHSDGVGSKRMIASLSQVQSTHYYIRDMSSYGESCFNVRQNPLIYDYGGKPYATTAADSSIDLFKNNGDGTSVLGIDCSGFVFTAMAAAGLKLKSGRALKASDSWAWGSSSYVEPQNNGLTCLNKISVTATQSLKAGDIVAVYGHVVLIDKVGADPFGINSARTEADCSKLSASNYDFVVSQSSPSKSGIGINYFEARDYVPTSSKIQTGLERYAYYSCLAKVNNKTYTPNVGTLSVVRHKGTSDCVAPRVKLNKESCIQSCTSLLR
ncbi:MAG: hypothetical protein AAGB31_06920 [Bdellovibrio sp.]